ncbi:hypothetical protein [Paraburkholderia sp. SIMBA_054]|uniref:hypothetical protein n=1 Tax=Paraburkholderia sp. SIMBA_054 TaxID=3085795 RepID=UPI00397C7A46
MIEHDPDAQRMIDWCESIRPPATAEDMAREIIWVILCAGRSAQAARTIEKKVLLAIEAGEPVVSVFGYRAKAAAIERAWRDRDRDFQSLATVIADSNELLRWCRAIPFIGDDTMYQLAKNFGANALKPDVWISRLTGFPDQPRAPVRVRYPACMALATMLSEATGDSIPVVDSLMWLACNKGILVTDAHARPVTFNPKFLTARSIYDSADDAAAGAVVAEQT